MIDKFRNALFFVMTAVALVAIAVVILGSAVVMILAGSVWLVVDKFKRRCFRKREY